MRWLKAREAAAYAGGISTNSLYAAVRSGRLKAARIGAGRNLLFCEAWLDEYLESLATPMAAAVDLQRAGPGHSADTRHGGRP